MTHPPPVAAASAALHPRVTRAIWRAAILELAASGYAGLSMERVARRARVGKAALYRRWPGKEAMILEMIGDIDLPIVAAADCGGLEADLADYVRNAARLVRRPLARRLLPEFYAEMNRDGALGRALRQRLFGAKASRVLDIVDRAVARGEIAAPQDPTPIPAIVSGAIYWALFIERRPGDAATVAALAGALAAAIRHLAGAG
jgi:AcrR family transcriptional regulator